MSANNRPMPATPITTFEPIQVSPLFQMSADINARNR